MEVYEEDDIFTDDNPYMQSLMENDDQLVEDFKHSPIGGMMENLTDTIFNIIINKDGGKDWDYLRDAIEEFYSAINSHKTIYSEAQIAIYQTLDILFAFSSGEIDRNNTRKKIDYYTSIIKKNKKRSSRWIGQLATIRGGAAGVITASIATWKINGAINNIFALLDFIQQDVTRGIRSSGSISTFTEQVFKSGLVNQNLNQSYKNIVESIIQEVRLNDASSYFNIIAQLLVKSTRDEVMMDTPSFNEQPSGWMGRIGSALSSGANFVTNTVTKYAQTDETMGIAKRLNNNLDDMFDSVDNLAMLLQLIVVSIILIASLAYLIMFIMDRKILSEYKSDYSNILSSRGNKGYEPLNLKDKRRRRTGPLSSRSRYLRNEPMYDSDDNDRFEYLDFGRYRRRSNRRKSRRRRSNKRKIRRRSNKKR